MFRLLALCACVMLCHAQTTRNMAADTCQSDQNSVSIEPDAEAMIVSLLDMRTSLADGVGCGQPDEVMTPAYEAMKWILGRLNMKNGNIDGTNIFNSYVPGIRIGMQVYDTCGSAKVATEKAISAFENFYVPTRYCNQNENKLKLGLIGASRSVVSQEVAGWLSHLKGPLVSFSSGSVSLGDASKYPFFMRTIPANSIQSQVIVELLVKLSWKKISVVYSDNEATYEDFQQLLRHANLKDVCVSQALPVKKGMSTASRTRILNKLKDSDTHGVLYLGYREEAYELLADIGSLQGADDLQWMFAGSISPDDDFVQKYGNRLRGFVAVAPHSQLSTEFRDYWTSLDNRNPLANNPWFQEWYMTVHNCKLPQINYQPYVSKSSCTQSTVSQTNYVQNQYVAAAIDAVMTYAKALKSAHAAKCGSTAGVCQGLKAMGTDEFFRDYLLKVQLNYNQDERISSWQKSSKSLQFDPSGELTAPVYDIWNYNNRAGGFSVVKVGDYKNRQLTVNLGDIQMFDATRNTALNPLPTYQCAASGCGICLTINTEEKYIEIDGDVLINAMLSVHEQAGGRCGTVSLAGAQQAQAYIYAIETVKSQLNILQGVDLGGIGFDDCGVSDRAASFIQQFESGVLDLKSGAGDPYTSKDVPVYVGAAGDEVSMRLADLLTRLKVPQISYGATTTDLSNLKQFPYFMRAVPSMRKQVNAIVQILRQMQWSFVQVVNAPDVHGRTGKRDFIQEAAANDICVTAEYEMNTSGTAAQIVQKLRERAEAKVVVVIGSPDYYNQLLTAVRDANAAGTLLLVGDANWGNEASVVSGVGAIAKGAISLDIRDPVVTAFRTYLSGIDVNAYSRNPWFREWYEKVYGCYLSAASMPMYTQACDPSKPITDAPNFSIDSHVLSVINSVFLSAMGIHRSLEKVCGAGYQTVCTQFKDAADRANMIVSAMEQASFRDLTSQLFTLDKREVNADFVIYNYNGNAYSNVGTFSTATKNLQLNQNAIVYYSTPVTSACTAGPSCNICLQKLKKVLFVPGDIYLAGMFGIRKMGDSVYTCGDIKTVDGFQNSEVFAYAIDLINNGQGPVRLNNVTLGGIGLDDCSSGFQTSNIISGVYTGAIPLGKDGERVQTDMIKAWIGYGSDETLSAAEELGKRQVPLISPSASSTALSDVASYPTFFRTVPTDFILTQSMVRLFLALDWKCVQIVYSPNSYGRAGYRTFRQNAKTEKLCVTQCLELETAGSFDQVVAALAKSPSKAVVVIAEGDKYLPQLLEAEKKANANLAFIGATTWGKLKSLVKGYENIVDKSLTIAVDNPVIPGFTNYLRTKYPNQYTRNPWFNDYYEALYKCDLPGHSKYGRQCPNPGSTPLTSSPDYEQENWVVPTMDAVYAAAAAIHQTLQDVCGENYNGMCPRFVSEDMSERIIGNLGKVRFMSARGKTFAFNSRSGGVGYDIYNFTQQQYNKVGTTVGLSPELVDPAGLKQASSRVATTCTPCEECPLDIKTSTEEQFIYLPGDILIGGMFDVHKRGLFPFTCDTIRPQYGYQLTEAFAFAIEQVNSKQGIFSDKLRGITLGGVGLDSCESAIRAGNLIADFHSGVIQLAKNGETVDPHKVKAYVGGMSTERSMQMADVLNEIGLPQISYGAAGMALHDRQKYPLFSRTIPANEKQVKAIIEFLKKYEINSVQVINSPGAYGEDGANLFIKLAIEEKICVSQNITFRDNGTVTDYSASEVVNLLLNRPNSTVVVTFMETDYINKFLNSLHYNKAARKMFRFVASEAWGKNKRVYVGAESEVRDTVAFNIDTGNVPGFDEYVGSKFPNTYIRNPWLPAYFQEVYQCTLPGSNLDYPKPCAMIDRSIVNADYEQESYVMYVVDAVYTAALGLDQTLRQICGQNYTGICDEWRSDLIPRQHLLNGIREAQFVDPALGKEFKFVSDGESIRGFEIYALQKYSSPGALLEYNLIGRYEHKTDTEMSLITSPSYLFNYKSDCSAENSCHMCPYMRTQLSRYMQRPAPVNVNMVAFFGVHDIGDNYLSCGKMNIEHGLIHNLAFFYGLHLVNTDIHNTLDDRVKIGGLAIDYCSSVNRMRGELFSYLNDDGLCLAAKYRDLFHPNTVVAYLTGGADTSMVAAEMLTPRHKLSVSQSMVYPEDSKTMYPYLMRTLPNCGKQGRAIFNIIEQYSWSFFMVVYTDDGCGRAGLKHLTDQANQRNFCLGKSHKMTKEVDEARALEIVEDLDEISYGKVVVLLTSEEHTVLILHAIKKLGLQGRFVLIGGDSMTDDEVADDIRDVALGSIILKLRQYPVPGFAAWVATMNDTNRLGLPEDWFHEFWQHTHKCHIRTAKVVLTQYLRPCTMRETLTVDMIEQDDHTLHIILSSMLVARGLSVVQQSNACTNVNISACITTNPQINDRLVEAIRAGNMQVLPDELGNLTFRLSIEDSNDAKISYTVHNYQKSGGKYMFKKIGDCDGPCTMTPPVYYDKNGQPGAAVSSVCPQDGATCICESRKEPRVIRPPPGIADQFTEIFGIIIVVLNIIGMLISFVLLFHFLCFYPNRGGTTVLGYIALAGIFLLFCFNFAYVLYAHPIVCGVRRFCQGVVYAIIFGALAVKCMCTWKNTNVSDDFQLISKKRYTHPCGLVVISLCFVSIQVMIALLWLILEPAMSENIIYFDQYWPRCTPHDFYNQGLVLSLLYVMFLMFLTLGFSGFSWPNTENNFEARYILGSTVFVMGTWMVWCIVSTMTSIRYRDGATAIGNIFCGYGILFFVYFRKCYLLHKFRKAKYSRKLGDTDDKHNTYYDNIAAQKDEDQMSDKSSGHGSL